MITSSEINSIEQKSYKDLKPEDIGDLIALKSNSKAYHSKLNELEKDLRAFIYDEIEADFYYLVLDTNSEMIVGGFTTSYNGNLNGLFSLVKGQGKKIFKLRLQYALGDILTIFCIGDKLKSLYENFNFKVEDTIKWDNELAPKNWNYERFGTPDLYIMRRLNEK